MRLRAGPPRGKVEPKAESAFGRGIHDNGAKAKKISQIFQIQWTTVVRGGACVRRRYQITDECSTDDHDGHSVIFCSMVRHNAVIESDPSDTHQLYYPDISKHGYYIFRSSNLTPPRPPPL